VALYDASAGELAQPQAPRETASIQAMLAPNGQLLAAVASGGEVALWDRERQEVRWVSYPQAPATAVCFSPDSLRLVVGSFVGGRLRVFDPQTGEEDGPALDGVAQGETPLAFSPDGKRFAAGVGNEVVLWDVASRQRLRVIRAGQAFVRKLAFHPGGRLLATAGDVPTLSLWDSEDGRS
jgi:WD40 repeat protein